MIRELHIQRKGQPRVRLLDVGFFLFSVESTWRESLWVRAIREMRSASTSISLDISRGWTLLHLLLRLGRSGRAAKAEVEGGDY
ncbi:hypothetical protein ACPOL_3638 [Acidisarcina polymorpha]|uniref:Uncharacterized protein n=1 Tax=Acidisarcina polymorpha TaxID=2211140 RepID=A0A2Z5G1E6_9BACT|nr:hypothetical protein ACPOL_3638 [Acidisarcina polymorpha]